MKITVIGTGYVGLVTAAIFSHFGNQVLALDIDKDKIKNLQKGQVPFFEPGLDKLIEEGLKKKNLIFTSSYPEALKQTEVIFICVGTPAKKDGDYDLSFVYKAAKEIGKNLRSYAVVCIKSTVPPSTSTEVKKIINKETKINFDLASCPEFLQEGSAVEDSFNPSRIIIGTESKRAKKLLLKLHQPIKAPRLLCDLKSSQLIKYAANAFLATKISYINSIARLCDSIGADIKVISKGLGLDPRIGDKFLDAGLGYGGSCFPKDTWALISFAKRQGIDFKFLKEVDNLNNSQIDYLISKIKKGCGEELKGKTLAILGLAFKPNTDDIREARAIILIHKLQLLGAKIKVFDPKAMSSAKKILKDVIYSTDPYDLSRGAEALILVTEWPEFKKIDFEKIARLMKNKVIIDGRNFWESNDLKKLGFKYFGVGRK